MGLVQPNNTTKAVVARPVTWALFIGVLAGVAFGALARSSGTAVAIGVGVGAFVVLFLLNVWLWSDDGPGARWYRRRANGL
jgi:hypothetical protein